MLNICREETFFPKNNHLLMFFPKIVPIMTIDPQDIDFGMKELNFTSEIDMIDSSEHMNMN